MLEENDLEQFNLAMGPKLKLKRRIQAEVARLNPAGPGAGDAGAMLGASRREG